jgi:hypothetical protein
MKVKVRVGRVGCVTVLFLACLAGCAAFGWVNNVVHLCKADFEHPYKNEILRGISVPFFPAGMVLGWLTFEEEK